MDEKEHTQKQHAFKTNKHYFTKQGKIMTYEEETNIDFILVQKSQTMLCLIGKYKNR